MWSYPAGPAGSPPATGDPDLAHAPFADELLQGVVPRDHDAGLGHRAVVGGLGGRGRRVVRRGRGVAGGVGSGRAGSGIPGLGRGPVEDVARLLVRRQEGRDGRAEDPAGRQGGRGTRDVPRARGPGLRRTGSLRSWPVLGLRGGDRALSQSDESGGAGARDSSAFRLARASSECDPGFMAISRVWEPIPAAAPRAASGSPRAGGAGRGRPRCGRRRRCGSPVATALRSRAIAASASVAASAAETPEPARPARPASAARAQAVSNHSSPVRDGRPSHSASARRASAAAPAGSPRSRRARPRRRKLQARWLRYTRDRRDLPDQTLAEGDRPVAAVAGLGRPAEAAEHVGEVVVAEPRPIADTRGPWGCRRPASGRSPAPGGTRPPPPPACPSATAGGRGCCGWPPGCCGIR